jgi:hypothetical protein
VCGAAAGVLVTDYRAIANHYFKSGLLTVDMVAVIPFGTMGLAFPHLAGLK